jgi:hypothetical protein
MYHLQVRIYDLSNRARFTAELYESEGQEQEPVVTAHLDLPALPPGALARHGDILAGCVLVCRELAQNYESPLF